MGSNNEKNILERFISIQGEGEYIGQLSIFIRFSGCNEICSFCDTKYSWDEEGKYSVNEILKYIKDNDNIHHIVFTGGEPMLHQDEILKIVKENQLKYFTIETNGTIVPTIELKYYMTYSGIWSVSPKSNKCQIEIFKQLSNTQFKFVIEDLKQIDEIAKMDLHYQKIIQPNGFREDYSQACKELAEYVIEKRYKDIRVLPQFHRIMWGQRRGI